VTSKSKCGLALSSSVPFVFISQRNFKVNGEDWPPFDSKSQNIIVSVQVGRLELEAQQVQCAEGRSTIAYRKGSLLFVLPE
jgi:hypothetical protein